MKVLETERLVLRPWRECDSGDLFEYACSELVGPNAGWKPHKDEKESKAIINMFIKDQDVYAIELKSENKVIGSIGLHKRVPDENLKELEQREVGYVLNPKYWGKGYVPEAVKRVLEYGFKELGLELIWCAHADFNENSRRVCEKSGFNYKFTKKDVYTLLDNKEVNSIFYNISKGEYYTTVKKSHE